MKTSLALRLLTALTMTALTAPTFAEDAFATPELTVRSYFAALQKRGVESMAEFMHPDEARRFKDLLMPIYEFEASAQERHLLDATFGADASLEKIKAAPPADFMRALAKLMAAQTAELAISLDAIDVLGSVPEPDKGLVHVLSRVQAGAMGIVVTKLDVTSLKLHDGRWKMMLTGDMEGLAQALRSRVPVPENPSDLNTERTRGRPEAP